MSLQNHLQRRFTTTPPQQADDVLSMAFTVLLHSELHERATAAAAAYAITRYAEENPTEDIELNFLPVQTHRQLQVITWIVGVFTRRPGGVTWITFAPREIDALTPAPQL
ncbi:MAG TPA: hypothetical protein VMT30_00440 [Candidatus Saccharimonadia bacterium]|nr:hypothetical protein [Candidatus Saccharimonadia bacterium]